MLTHCQNNFLSADKSVDSLIVSVRLDSFVKHSRRIEVWYQPLMTRTQFQEMTNEEKLMLFKITADND